jgi:hypothetical protein
MTQFVSGGTDIMKNLTEKFSQGLLHGVLAKLTEKFSQKGQTFHFK